MTDGNCGYYGGKGGKGGKGGYYGGKGGKGGKGGYYNWINYYNWMGPGPVVENANWMHPATVVTGYYGVKGGKGGYYGGKGGKGAYYNWMGPAPAVETAITGNHGFGGKGGKSGYYGGKGGKGGIGAALVFAYVEDALEPAYEKAPKPISYGMTSSTRSIDKVKQMFETYEGLDVDETMSSSTVLAENDVPWSDAPPTQEANFEIASSSIFSEEQPSSVQGFSSTISAAVPSSISSFFSCVKITAVVGALVYALL